MSIRRPRLKCFTENEIDDYNFNYELNYDNILDIFLSWNKSDVDKYFVLNKEKGCFITKLNEEVIYVNDKWCQIFGYSKNEIIGKNFKILEGENTDLQKCYQFKQNLLKNNEAEMNIINYKKNNDLIKLKVISRKSIDKPYYYGFIEEIIL